MSFDFQLQKLERQKNLNAFSFLFFTLTHLENLVIEATPVKFEALHSNYNYKHSKFLELYFFAASLYCFSSQLCYYICYLILVWNKNKNRAIKLIIDNAFNAYCCSWTSVARKRKFSHLSETHNLFNIILRKPFTLFL